MVLFLTRGCPVGLAPFAEKVVLPLLKHIHLCQTSVDLTCVVGLFLGSLFSCIHLCVYVSIGTTVSTVAAVQ